MATETLAPGRAGPRPHPGALGTTSARLVATAVALAALVAPAAMTPAAAHEFDNEHRAIATVSHLADGGLDVQVLLLMKMPAGEATDRVLVLFDIDRDGALSPGEAKLVADHLGSQAVGGYLLRVQGRPGRPTAAQASATLTPQGELVVAVLLTYRPKVEAGAPVTIGVEVLPTPAGSIRRSPPVIVELQSRPPLAIRQSSHPVATDAPVVGPVRAAPGAAAVWFTVTPRSQTADPVPGALDTPSATP